MHFVLVVVLGFVPAVVWAAWRGRSRSSVAAFRSTNRIARVPDYSCSLLSEDSRTGMVWHAPPVTSYLSRILSMRRVRLGAGVLVCSSLLLLSYTVAKRENENSDSEFVLEVVDS